MLRLGAAQEPYLPYRLFARQRTFAERHRETDTTPAD